MRRVTSILYGAIVLAIASVNAQAQDESMIAEDVATSAGVIYEVDDDRDGRADRLLILERSDLLA